jgi:hypothetical protein
MTSCRGLAVCVWQCISGEHYWSLGVNVSSSRFYVFELESGTGETRVVATGEGVEFVGKQSKIRSRKYERKEKNRSSMTLVVQAIMVANRSQ